MCTGWVHPPPPFTSRRMQRSRTLRGCDYSGRKRRRRRRRRRMRGRRRTRRRRRRRSRRRRRRRKRRRTRRRRRKRRRRRGRKRSRGGGGGGGRGGGGGGGGDSSSVEWLFSRTPCLDDLLRVAGEARDSRKAQELIEGANHRHRRLQGAGGRGGVNGIGVQAPPQPPDLQHSGPDLPRHVVPQVGTESKR